MANTRGVYIPVELTGPELRSLEMARVIDCNCNGVADSLDIVKGVLHDANGDGHPDECEADGVTDDCLADTT